MRQNIKIRNVVDGEGNPAGGMAHSEGNDGVTIHWQDGPVKDGKPNGAFVEDILEICQRRIEFYQNSKFACGENAMAIEFIACARNMLGRRYARRVEAGTANSHEGN